MLRGGRLRPSPWEIGLNKFLFLRIKRDGEGQALMGGGSEVHQKFGLF